MKQIIFTLLFSIVLFWSTGISQVATKQTPATPLNKKVEKKEEACKKEKKLGVEIHGYVRYEAFYDTREVVDSRQGEVILYPTNHDYDKYGSDINESPTFQMLGLQSRLQAKITGPDAFGAKTSGIIEGDFLGRSQTFLSHFRLRHAFFKLNWEKFELLMGQTWHPMFVPEVCPSVLSMAAAAPYNPLNRTPQIRATYKLGDMFQLIGVLASHRDFAHPGDEEALRKSARPDMNLQVKVGCPKTFLMGATFGYKYLEPRMKTDNGIKTEQVIGGFHSEAFLKINTTPMSIKLLAAHGQGMGHLVMIGGYAKKATEWEVENYEYTNLRTTSMWADIQSNGKKVILGFFAGYSKIDGAEDEVDPSVMIARSADIDYIIRISPRIIFRSGKVDLGAEVMYNQAAYAKDHTADWEAINSSIVDHYRFLFSAKYSF